MKNAILFLTALFLFSCGASKKNKREQSEELKTEQVDIVKKDVDLTTNTKIETKTFVDENTKEEIEETVFVPIDNNKPAIFGKDTITNGKLSKRKIKRNKDVKQNGNTNISNDTKTTDKSEIQGKKTAESKTHTKEKTVDREQFNVGTMLLQLWWLWLIVIILIYLYRKYGKLLYI